uniref:Uncharacterized protein n=1 Tax=Anguilla anguilla TaxID=7936 RepID=A0A0E9TK16_ANGAN
MQNVPQNLSAIKYILYNVLPNSFSQILSPCLPFLKIKNQIWTKCLPH